MKKKIKFGLAIPTGTEGLMVNLPYASARDVVELSVFAEKIGLDSVWGNDHIHSQKYVLKEFGASPRYYSPLLELAAIAERTTKLEVCTALLVAPFRQPAVMAKELITLDHLSNGRVKIGIGLGAYREEFEAEFGKAAAHMVRGKMLDESLEIMTRLFKEEYVTYNGEYFNVQELQTYPKPVQMPFPFYIGGNSDNSFRRVAKFGTGWLPAILTVDEIRYGVQGVQAACEKAGRSLDEIDIAPQFGISVCKTHEEALEKFQNSQLYRHGISLAQSTMKGRDATNYAARNLVGSVDEVIERIQQYIDAGVTHFSALTFVDKDIERTKESMQFFAEEVLPAFK